ncbi:carnosine synthase 1-like isoform X1 [Babylonia areolata]|uniref:carnosine synthase 1-like isoform X1 n=1 Tax=Babylonia areolata TaxID=304850 RepID=UPI003FD42D7A
MSITTLDVDSGEFSQPCQKQLHFLQTVLTDLKLPATVDRRGRPRSGEGPQITVVLLADLVNVLNIFLEGNRQYPDGFLYVPTASWLSRDPSPGNSGMDTLHVHQAVTSASGGQTYLDVFCPPRRATYLDNHLYRYVARCGMEDLEEVGGWGLDLPTCSSLVLNARTEDKLLTTTMCAAVGVAHPVTLGLWLPGHRQHPYPLHHPSVTVVRLTSRDEDKGVLDRAVRDFLGSTRMRDYEKVVVKPFGVTWGSCRGVSYHDRHDVTSVLEAVLHLLTVIDAGTGLLVQSYRATFPPVRTSGLGRHALDAQNTQLGFRIRAIVVRTPDNGAYMTQAVCDLGDSSQPIGGAKAVPISLSLTLTKWGVKGEGRQRAIYRAVAHTCEEVMAELMRQEAMLTNQQRGGHGCQTELVGIDLILSQEKGSIVPVVIEVNTHDCLFHVTMMEMMQPRLRGLAVNPLIRTMLHRSQRHVLEGRTVVVIGGGGYSKRHLWTEGAELGVKVVLVDSDPRHPASRWVHTFLHVDMSDHRQDTRHALTITRLLRDTVAARDIAGCLAWWEDCVPLAARVGQALGLKHAVSVEAVLNAKSKERTHSVLGQQREVPPHQLPTAAYASPVLRVATPEQLHDAVTKVSLPAVMKLEFGSGAVGVKHVHSMKEACQHMELVDRNLRSDADFPGVGLGHGQSMVMMPRLVGTEHDVDVVLFQGQLVAAFISDNSPTHMSLSMETVAVMPSLLPTEQQQQLIRAAASCCRGLGLHTGVYNVEMMMTSCGARLLEVNARIGGYYLRQWIRLIYNVDIFHLALMCACGIRPVLSGSSSLEEEQKDRGGDLLSSVQRDDNDLRKGCIMGIMLCPSRHAQALATTASPEHLQALHQKGDIIFSQFEAEVVPQNGAFKEPYGNLAVRAPCLQDAKTKLMRVSTSLGLETEESLLEVLSDFVDLSQ